MVLQDCMWCVLCIYCPSSYTTHTTPVAMLTGTLLVLVVAGGQTDVTRCVLRWRCEQQVQHACCHVRRDCQRGVLSASRSPHVWCITGGEHPAHRVCGALPVESTTTMLTTTETETAASTLLAALFSIVVSVAPGYSDRRLVWRRGTRCGITSSCCTLFVV